MNTSSVKQLNDIFSFQKGNNKLCFKTGAGEIPVIDVQNEQASTTISLQGAQVLSWKPVGEDEVIWVSDEASFVPGKSVRGGIPICWPWFGAHGTGASYPAHGFARTCLWQVVDAQPMASGETQITFRLDTRQLDERIQAMWPLAAVAEFRLTIGSTLTMTLTTLNHSEQAITIGQALHTYFAVEDVRQTSVFGLEGRDYLDKTEGFKRKIQEGPVIIESEVDRVYLQTADDIIVDDNKRKISITKQGSQSTIVWNPWQAVAQKMGDLGQDGYLKMLCVESANAAEDIVTINPGEGHTLTVTYAII